MEELLKAVASHLEFYGYSCVVEDNAVKAYHETKPRFWVLPIYEGAFFRALFETTAQETSSQTYLDFVNWCNSLATVARFVQRDKYLSVEGWFPNCYDKKTFAAFFTQYLADIQSPGKTDAAKVQQFFPE